MLAGSKSRLALVILSLVLAAPAQQTATVEGTVHDANGRPISGATVTLTAAHLSTRTDEQGRFSLTAPSPNADEVLIFSAGWAPLRFQWHPGDPARVWRLGLNRLEQRVTVVGEPTTRSVSQFDRAELSSAPAHDLDSTLRQVPGFTLFRRTPSWSANPTTQGVSLRGAGASGTSRAAVILNGIPLNDPFGGWVYWGRVAPDTIDQAVIVQGGASELYGTQALGGAVELIRSQPSQQHLTVTTYVGNLFTPGGSLVGDSKIGKWWVGGAGSLFRTNGYVPVAVSEQGSVDTVSNSENASGWLQVERNFGQSTRLFLGGNLYGESRQNGTYLQFNSATIRELRTGLDLGSFAGGALSVRVYGGTEDLRQTFSAVAADRSTESLTRDQSVPVNQIGISAVWSKNAWSRHSFTAGFETARIEGDSEEWAYLQGLRTSRILSGGVQFRLAGFVEDRIRLNSRTLLAAGVRLDHWVNRDARTRTEPLLPGGVLTQTDYADRSETFASPRLGIDFAATSRIILKASVSRAFRSPTLNELYRSFRVGNVLTLANADLTSERQTGIEAGATYSLSSFQTVTGTYFWSRVADPVTNRTLTITPALITRQRQNLGSLRSTGVEFSWNSHWSKSVSSSVAYQFAHATVTSFSPDPSLVGLWIPQVARNNAKAQLRFEQPGRFTVVVGGRYQGLQFDDDRNLFGLGGYFVGDAYVSKNIRPNLLVFTGIENMLDRRYQVARTPVTMLGPPVLARVGVKFYLGDK
jgi:outer membrane receptor protein involved in Fe transport